MRVLAIDPGTTESGWVLYDGKVIDSGVSQNEALIDQLAHEDADLMAVEMIASYGMAVGREVFETCVWIGRFIQATPIPHKLITRQKVSLHVCKSPKAKDANIRRALIDKIGPVGTKKSPGPTYGVKSHAWAALAVAVTAVET